MKQAKINSGTFFQREVESGNYLGMGLIQVELDIKEKTFYLFDNKDLSLIETDINLSKEEEHTYKSACISGLFTSIDFLDFPEHERFSSCILIPLNNNICFLLTIKKGKTIFYPQNGDSFYSIADDVIQPVTKEIKTIGDTVLSIARQPVWSAGDFENISFQGFTTEAFKHYKICQKAFNDFVFNNITEKEFLIINQDNFHFITGYNDSMYIECIKNILQKDSDFLKDPSFYFSNEESVRRSSLIKQSLEEVMK
tara:strand:- start:37287 stop:38048 length:762 start_codon:yes stop_codon:yes gene_type:complete